MPNSGLDARELAQQTRLLEMLRSVAFASNDSVSFLDVLGYALNQIAEFQQWPLGHIWLRSPDGVEELTPSDIWYCKDRQRFEPFMAATRDRTFTAGMGLPGRVLARKRPTWVGDVRTDPSFLRSNEAAACGIRGAFSFPVLAGPRVAAVLDLYADEPVELDAQLLTAVEQMGALLGRVAEREQAAAERRLTQSALEDRVLERTAELEKVNRSLQNEVEQRRQAEKVKDELVATVSHELRTPLASIRGFTELLLTREFAEERRREMLEVILKEAFQLTDLIEDLLDIQKVAVGKLAYHCEDFDLSTLVRDAVRNAQARTREHRIAAGKLAELGAVYGDPNRIRQVLNNLLSNAIRYSPGGGDIEVSMRQVGELAEISVSDHGLGIPSDAIGKLFTKFYRVDNSATRSINGTGLGLALIKSIVEDHGGEVGVESVEGQGSRFWFRLPLIPVGDPATV
ncbi:MAG: GAF domain-containing protein [Acidobacteria bacterium]|nr:GAF domain-containing protein [Acidobacteriota bacterium]